MTRSRRTVLVALAAGPLGTALAGCRESDPPTDTEAAPGESGSPSGSPRPRTDVGVTSTPAADALDLREANVVGVAVEERDGGSRFEVSLHHDDAGEPGYANWWQVESLDGTRLGQRDLLHAHDQQPFTRSATVQVPAGVTCVVVRGHDQTHGYGGRAMLVNLETGRTRGIDQGRDPRSVDASACPP